MEEWARRQRYGTYQSYAGGPIGDVNNLFEIEEGEAEMKAAKDKLQYAGGFLRALMGFESMGQKKIFITETLDSIYDAGVRQGRKTALRAHVVIAVVSFVVSGILTWWAT